MKTIVEILSEAKQEFIRTTAIGKIDIFGIKMNSSTKTKINNSLDHLYKNKGQMKFNEILDKVEEILETFDVCVFDEEYSKGYKSFDLPKGTNREFQFDIGKLSSMKEANSSYKPISEVYNNVELKMFLFKEDKTVKVESIYLA